MKLLHFGCWSSLSVAGLGPCYRPGSTYRVWAASARHPLARTCACKKPIVGPSVRPAMWTACCNKPDAELQRNSCTPEKRQATRKARLRRYYCRLYEYNIIISFVFKQRSLIKRVKLYNTLKQWAMTVGLPLESNSSQGK